MYRIEKVFAVELNMIKDDKIRQFVIDTFTKLCPDYFWTVPCSTSGKYHPQYALGEGGLVRHVKSAIWWGVELSRSMQMEKFNDEMVAALLLHDLIKNGEGLDADGKALDKEVSGRHGVTLADKLCDIRSEMADRSRGLIRSGIARHMGIWTTDHRFVPDDDFTKLIHLADYCASRKVDELISTLTKEKTDG